MAGKRRDKKRVILRTGESYRECDGRYFYRWTDAFGKRRAVYAKNLKELREKEEQIASNYTNSEESGITLNDIYDIWKDVKRGIKNSTLQSYCDTYNRYVAGSIGKLKLSNIKKSTVKRFYNSLAEDRGLSVPTIDDVQTVVHQVFELAIDDEYITQNPSRGALRDLRRMSDFKGKKRFALTASQEKAFFDYIRCHKRYAHWYPIFAVMVGTGLRMGEVTGLRWCDVNLKKGFIDVNHTLIYYSYSAVKGKNKRAYCPTIGTPKTPSSRRKIPMLNFVKKAFEMEKQYCKSLGIVSQSVIEGYSDFVFLNHSGKVHKPQNVNAAIRRILRSYNSENADQKREPIPDFTSHSLRHTFATRMCEWGVNVKVIQALMGHSDISMTMNIYTDVTEDMEKIAFERMNAQFKNLNFDTNLTPIGVEL